MKGKMFFRALLFPRLWMMILLLPVATALLVLAMVFLGTQSPMAIASYVLAAYTLTVWCVRLPYLIRFFKTFFAQNKYARRYADDERLRVKLSLYGAVFANTAFAVFQLGLGIRHRSFWFFSIAGYYILLALMRFALLRHTRRYAGGECLKAELSKYRACGIVLLFMNLALSLIVFFMIYFGRTFLHHEITTITMAAYTFLSFAFAIVGMVRYRKYESPVYSASKAIGLVAAAASLLTLESTMLTTFGEGTMDLFSRRLFLGLTGGAVAAFILVIAVYMIVQGTKKIKQFKD